MLPSAPGRLLPDERLVRTRIEVESVAWRGKSYELSLTLALACSNRTMTSPQRWTYLNVPDERRRKLESFGDFDRLLGEVVKEAACNFVRWEDGSNEVPPEFFRPVFRVLLLRTGDALFNGPHGLRAAYYRDADEGAKANRRLLSALENKLLATVKPSGERGQDLTGAQLALRGGGSKIWSETNPYGVQPGGPDPQLDNCRWQDAAQLESPDGNCDARRGIDAARVECFHVKGAWRNARNKTCITKDKLGRAADIHAKGSS